MRAAAARTRALPGPPRPSRRLLGARAHTCSLEARRVHVQAAGAGGRETRHRTRPPAREAAGVRLVLLPPAAPSPVPPLPGPDVPVTQEPRASAGPGRPLVCETPRPCVARPAGASCGPEAAGSPVSAWALRGRARCPPRGSEQNLPGLPRSVAVPVSNRDFALSLLFNSVPRGPVSKVRPSASCPLRRDAASGHGRRLRSQLTVNAVQRNRDVVAESVINAGTVPSSVCPEDSAGASDATVTQNAPSG